MRKLYNNTKTTKTKCGERKIIERRKWNNDKVCRKNYTIL